MLILGIRYLNCFAAASDVDNRDHVEWPPHPGRVFVALAAAHFQTGTAVSERTALEWLENLGSPQMRASGGEARAVVTHYVPVNDAAGPSKAMLQSVPLTRDRQPRTFARTWLDDDTVWLVWPDAEPAAETRTALANLCEKVTRIGHSSSLVQMWLADGTTVEPPNWLPDDAAFTVRLRVAVRGTLAELDRRFNGPVTESYAALRVAEHDAPNKAARDMARKQLREEFGNEAPRCDRPQLSTFQGYATRTAETGSPTAPATVFSPHLLALTLERRDGPYRYLELADALALTGRMHEALCSYCNDLDPEVAALISGRGTNQQPLETPHLALVPLAFVGHPHADGRLLGMALAFPENISREVRHGALIALGRLRQRGLELGRLGRWELLPVVSQRPPLNLRPETWTAHPDGATHWATVTPIAFDQHAKAKEKAAYQAELSETIRLACQRIAGREARLPEPREVIITPVSAHLGAPPAHAFPRLQRKDGSQRRHAHAILVFPEPVRGPILLGAGRYRGYGLCRPLDSRQEAQPPTP
jgi:CRISPR-associated protein Csb2